jgi:hypothetical protein
VKCRRQASYELRDYRQVDGAWLPFEMVRRHHIFEFSTVHQVQWYQVNQVSPSRFDSPRPPGTYIHNRDTDAFSQTPGGLPLLNDLVRYAAGQMEPPTRSNA